MPGRNIIRSFVEDGYYHVYNRGVEKRQIFMDDHDFEHFLWIISEYLQADHTNPNNAQFIRRGLCRELSVMCFCLMPNHFHILVKQKTINGLTRFMRRVCTMYATYFNNRYERCGSLFQGKYKASQIDKDAYLTYITNYIHRNPSNYSDYKYSSYQDHIGKNRFSWLNTQEILQLFSLKNGKSPEANYENYVKSHDLGDNTPFKDICIDVE